MVATSCKLCEVGSSNMMHILYATASSLESESLFRLHRLYRGGGGDDDTSVIPAHEEVEERQSAVIV